jgi:glycosyltransferase involved in cell wall biosynthesis
LKIIHISTYDKGGAANAAIRLHSSLVDQKIDSVFLTASKTKFGIKNHFTISKSYGKIIPDQTLNLKNLFLSKFTNKYKSYYLNKVAKKKYKNLAISKGAEIVTFLDSEYSIEDSPLVKNADIIHLHWVGDFINYETFFTSLNKPIVWTFHDENPFRGIYHYKNDEFNTHEELKQLDTIVKNKKKIIIEKFKSLTIVTPSKWLYDAANENKFCLNNNWEIIPYGINTSIFKLYPKNEVRKVLEIDNEKPVILFAAETISTQRKGFDLFIDALKYYNLKDKLYLMAIGSPPSNGNYDYIKFWGQIHDEKLMALLYSSSDLFILPSIEDNLPNTMLESLCCGTPVVGFSIGGIKESITNGINGYLAQEISSKSLAAEIVRFLTNRHLFSNIIISKNASEKYSLKKQADDYISVYSKLLNTNA